MLQLRNRVKTAECRLWETSAVSSRTIPSVDVATVVFHRISLKATVTTATLGVVCTDTAEVPRSRHTAIRTRLRNYNIHTRYD